MILRAISCSVTAKDIPCSEKLAVYRRSSDHASRVDTEDLFILISTAI
jgi:hypothetical protein